MKIVSSILLAGVLGLVLFTGWALESSGVAVIETRNAEGALRSTHVWFAESDSETWLEAGTPENGWYIDIQAQPLVSFYTVDSTVSTDSERQGPRRYVAQIIPGEAAHRRIRTLLREKYGVRDWWVGVLFDTSRSVAVRLVPE